MPQCYAWAAASLCFFGFLRSGEVVALFCTIRVFIPYAYGTYHTRIRIWYNHTRIVRIIVPYAYSVYETPLVYIVSSLRP